MRLSRVLLLALLFGVTPALADSANVFILHSYSQEYPWTKRQHEGFVAGIRSGERWDTLVSTEYLDTKRTVLKPKYIAGFRDYLRTKYRDYQPDVIYVTDDNAFTFAHEELRALFPETPLVFSGVNDYSILDQLDNTRVTGVFEKKEIAPNLRIIKDTGAGSGRIAFVGDGSETYEAIKREIVAEL